VQAQGKSIMGIVGDTKAIFIITIVQMVQFFIMLVILGSCANNDKLPIASIISMVISISLYFLICLYFMGIMSGVKAINKASLNYYVSN